jgi:hypothetical protein
MKMRIVLHDQALGEHETSSPNLVRRRPWAVARATFALPSRHLALSCPVIPYLVRFFSLLCPAIRALFRAFLREYGRRRTGSFSAPLRLEYLSRSGSKKIAKSRERTIGSENCRT